MKMISLLVMVVVLTAAVGSPSAHSNEVRSDSIAQGGVPSLAVDARGNLHLVYGKGDSVWYRYSADGGHSFSAPELVGSLPRLFSFAMRGPQIAAAGNAVVIIATNQRGNLYAFRKEARGPWVRTARINDADTTVKEGFSALSSDGKGHLFAAWLDLRKGGHNNIYGARSADGGKTWTKNQLVYSSPDGHVCECCKPSVAMQGNHIAVMFRNWVAGSRDLYLAESADGGKTFSAAQKLGMGTWPLKGCPMDGGGLAFDSKGQTQTVWQRQGSIYTCQPRAAEKEIGRGRGCTMTATGKGPVYAWTEEGKVVCLLPNGQKQRLGEGSLPVLQALSAKEVVCVWQQKNAINRTLLAL